MLARAIDIVLNRSISQESRLLASTDRRHHGERLPPNGPPSLEVFDVTTETAEDAPNEMGGPLLEQIMELWLRPELERRGLDTRPEDVGRALVILKPGEEPEVLIDAEAAMIVRGKPTRPIAKGERVTEADLESIEALLPHDIDPDAGWIGFARFKGTYTIAFDFRRNKAKAQRIVDLASDYLAAAQLAAQDGRKGPAVDNLHSAAELTVVAQMSLMYDKPPGGHGKRQYWFESWVEHGNAPSDHGRALRDLVKCRPPARYAGKPLRLTDAELGWLISQVSDMVEHARKTITGGPGS
jgi:hypothetical protein